MCILPLLREKLSCCWIWPHKYSLPHIVSSVHPASRFSCHWGDDVQPSSPLFPLPSCCVPLPQTEPPHLSACAKVHRQQHCTPLQGNISINLEQVRKQNVTLFTCLLEPCASLKTVWRSTRSFVCWGFVVAHMVVCAYVNVGFAVFGLQSFPNYSLSGHCGAPYFPLRVK